MKKSQQKQVLNQLVLQNFDKVTQEQSFLAEDWISQKPLRNPQQKKQRDQARRERREHWND